MASTNPPSREASCRRMRTFLLYVLPCRVDQPAYGVSWRCCSPATELADPYILFSTATRIFR